MEKDKLFLLSLSEVKKYLKKEMLWFNGDAFRWWLRSPGFLSTYAAYVFIVDNGILSPLVKDGYNVNISDTAVRPAIHLNLAHFNSLEKTIRCTVKFGGREWLVLNEETGLLLSKDAVCNHCFDIEHNDYERSEIRAYLNDKLFDELFTLKEQEMIVETVIDGETSYPAA